MTRFRLGERATAAIEFSLIAPVFLMLILGGICFGKLFGTYHSVQELAAAAARAAVAGLSDSERSSLSQQYIAQNVNSYVFLDPTKLSVTVSTIDSTTRSFTLSVSYDDSASFVYAFAQIIPLPNSHIQMNAIMQRGGY